MHIYRDLPTQRRTEMISPEKSPLYIQIQLKNITFYRPKSAILDFSKNIF